MSPKLELLDQPLLQRILREAFQLLEALGVKIVPCVSKMLRAAGARVEHGVAHIPEGLARNCLSSAPRDFHLYTRAGHAAVHYGGDDIHFDPGSSSLNILDPDTRQTRPARACDLVRLAQAAEMLPEYAAQSTAVVCDDVPQEAGDCTVSCWCSGIRKSRLRLARSLVRI